MQMLRENPHRVRHLGPIVLLYNLNVGLALASLSTLNIPAYNVMKRLTPCAVILLQVTILRKPVPSKTILISVGITVAGSLVTGWGNIYTYEYSQIFIATLQSLHYPSPSSHRYISVMR